ncbi:MAG: FG-GAP repeat protein, partial [Verrucomicrobiales bacterium]|nr:FG-GAP repeat protein [Verrucomicrobiales bacterium]
MPISLTVNAPKGIDFGTELTFTSRVTTTGAACPPPPAFDQASAVAEMRPMLHVFKKDVLDLIPSGGYLDYKLTLYNTGEAPSHGTWVVDRIPAEMVFTEAYGPQGEMVWFSSDDDLPPNFLSPSQPIDASVIAAKFSPGIHDDGGTPSDPTDDVWTSPFGDQTRWVAWEMDAVTYSPPLYPVGMVHEVGFRVKNDLDGPGSGTAGSPSGNVIFNTTGVFSDELLQAIGNEVVTTIKDAPGILVQKTGPSVVSSGEDFAWTVSYYNNSGIADDIVTVTDILPAGVEFVSATHTWNAAALGNGAPTDNNSQSVPSSVTANPDGTTTVTFNISGAAGYCGNGTDLASLEGGTIVINARVASGTASGVDVRNRVTGTAVNGLDSSSSSDEHLVLVRNAEIGVTKFGSTANPVAGDTLTYTLIVRNTGLKDATNVVVADILPAGLTFVPGSASVLTSGYTLGAPDVSGSTLTWSVAFGNALTKAPLAPGILPAFSGDVVIQYKATVLVGTVPGTDLENTVTVTTDTPEDNTVPNSDNEQVTTPYPDPAVYKDGPDFVQPGSRFTWTIDYWNASREAATGVYVIDTLPDYTADGETDVTFIGQSAPAGVTAYYHAGVTSSVPAFDPGNPTAGGWSATPTTPVNHIAWLVGALGPQAGPFQITLTAEATRPNGGSPAPLPAGVNLDNQVTIHLVGTDNDPSNNSDNHITRTPGNDIALTKTGSVEGNFPGLAPGAPLAYTLTLSNSGTQTAYGVEIQDTLPALLTLQSPPDNFLELVLTDASGSPVQAVDLAGAPITDPIPVTRVVSGSTVRWYLGTNSSGDALYYRKVGLPTGAETSFKVYTRVLDNVANGTALDNTATAILHNEDDSVPAELVTTNNTDTSSTVVCRPDLTVRKSVTDAATGSEQWTESGNLLTYRIDYNNLGYAPASNSVISEIVPAGTSLANVVPPLGSSVTYYPGPGATNATSFDVNLGTVPAPANLAGVPQNLWLSASSAVELANGKNGIPAGSWVASDYAGNKVINLGDLDGDGVTDIAASAYNNDDGGSSAGGVWVMLLNADGTAKSALELTNGKNGIPASSFLANDFFGYSLEVIGDVDGDGVPDLAVGAYANDDGALNAGAAWVVLLNSDGSAKSAVELANGKNGIPLGSLAANDWFGYSVGSIGDVDGDGVPDIVVGANQNDDGGINAGAAWVILLNADGTAKSAVELADGKNGIPGGSLAASDNFGVPSIGVGDVDGDGTPDIAVGAKWNSDGALNAGATWVILLNPDGTAKSAVELADGKNGVPSGSLPSNAEFGIALAAAGDVNGDGVNDLLVGSWRDSTSGSFAGAAWVILLNADGSAQSAVKLINGQNGFPSDGLVASNFFGASVASAGDLDNDGVPDLIVGAPGNSDGGSGTGAAWVILLNADGSAKLAVKLAAEKNGIPAGEFLAGDSIGTTVEGIGDLNGDGLPDFLISAHLNDDGAASAGGMWIIFSEIQTGLTGQPNSLLDGTHVSGGQLNIEFYPGSALSVTEIANGKNGLPSGSLAAFDQLSEWVASVGDIDGDGIADVVASATRNDDGGSDAGGVWVFLLNADGSAKSAVELANGKNGIPANSFLASDYAGQGVFSIGDLDSDGVPDLVMGARSNDDGASNAGAVWIVFLNSDGRAKSVVEIANGKSGLPGGSLAANDNFGHSVSSAGDVDSDGVPDIIVGALNNDDGGTDAGAAWVLLLNSNGTVKSAVELADGKNGIPGSMILPGDYFGVAVSGIGDVDKDGVPDVAVGANGNDDGGSFSGAVWVVLLNSDGTAKSAVELADGKNGFPTNSNMVGFGYSITTIGDVDNDGVLDIAAGAPNSSDGGPNRGKAWVMLLNSNGTAKSTAQILSGTDGFPSGLSVNYDFFGQSVHYLGDLDGDGIGDLAMGSSSRDTGALDAGSAWIIMLNSNGTVRGVTELGSGVNGMPAGSLASYDSFGYSIAVSDDINGDGVVDLIVGAYGNDDETSSSGAVWIVNLDPKQRYYSTGSVTTQLPATSGISAWDKFFSEADIPNGTSLTYSIGRMVAGTPTYDLGAQWTNISGPLPASGLDLSSIDAGNTTLVAKVDFASDTTVRPTLYNLFATYNSDTWPGFTFTVRVDDPVAAGQSDVFNSVAISTSTPELRSDNNLATDDILIRLTDLAVTKSTDKAAAL